MSHHTIKIKGRNFARPFILSFNKYGAWAIDKPARRNWPKLHTEHDIKRALSKLSYYAAQKEYFNIPMSVQS